MFTRRLPAGGKTGLDLRAARRAREHLDLGLARGRGGCCLRFLRDEDHGVATIIWTGTCTPPLTTVSLADKNTTVTSDVAVAALESVTVSRYTCVTPARVAGAIPVRFGPVPVRVIAVPPDTHAHA